MASVYTRYKLASASQAATDEKPEVEKKNPSPSFLTFFRRNNESEQSEAEIDSKNLYEVSGEKQDNTATAESLPALLYRKLKGEKNEQREEETVKTDGKDESNQTVEEEEAVCPTCGQVLPSDFGNSSESEASKRAREFWQKTLELFSRKK